MRVKIIVGVRIMGSSVLLCLRYVHMAAVLQRAQFHLQ